MLRRKSTVAYSYVAFLLNPSLLLLLVDFLMTAVNPFSGRPLPVKLLMPNLHGVFGTNCFHLESTRQITPG
ncbi:hypothetical protein SSYM_1763 [Serratia symbiotica str. Tucson]|uniref:Uncharacterized protein n=1 Tax=Serratia symbiotica str. Tucson TaxID=914128 RepID=E9CN51_9GAMM|nr:hypothetical protein SSYM_1763 [Serratia symbiotica str. Tucson]